MATLHVRDVPDDLYEGIRQAAAMENRSISAEVIAWLTSVYAEARAASNQKRLLSAARRRRTALAAAWASQQLEPIDVTAMIREERSRDA